MHLVRVIINKHHEIELSNARPCKKWNTKVNMCLAWGDHIINIRYILILNNLLYIEPSVNKNNVTNFSKEREENVKKILQNISKF